MALVLQSLADLTALQAQKDKIVLFFWAEWHDLSKAGGQMQGIYGALAEKYPKIKFALVEAEMVPELSEKLAVTVVPTFFTAVGTKVIAKLEGATPATLSKLVKELDELTDASSVPSLTGEEERKEAEKAALFERLKFLIHASAVMLFMKGSSDKPKCGFSRQMVEILTENKIPFSSFDILTDEAVRAGLKEYSDWPTYPQLYVKGTLIGGLDILKEMARDGDLVKQLGVEDLLHPPMPPLSLEERLRALINQAPVMLFMKGTPDAPKCGFSNTIVGILREAGIEFSSFNILADEEVRQGLKDLSDWPTYPQLYVKGQLAGGLDIVKEMNETGDLKEQLGL